MQMLIQSRDFSLTDELNEHVRRRFNSALRHGARRLVRVVIRLVDLNGPRGGMDKQCRVELRFTHGGPIVADGVDADLHVAIDRAASRSKQLLLDRLQRARHRRARGRGLQIAKP